PASGTVTVLNTGADITVAAGINVRTAGNGAVTQAATDFNLSGAINSGTGRTTLANSTPGRQIDLGTNTPDKVGLTQAELNTVTAGILQIGSVTSGDLNVSATIAHQAPWNTLTLISGDTVTEAAAGTLGSFGSALP